MLFPVLGRRRTTHVAVDIGTCSIKLAAIRKGPGNEPTISHTASIPTPAGSLGNGRILDPAPVADAIREYLRRWRSTSIAGVTAVPWHTAMIKVFELPAHERAAPEIEARAMRLVPENPEPVFFDYHMDNSAGETDHRQVVLVAARKEIVRSYIEVLSRAGLVPRIVDIDCFALHNLRRLLHPDSPDGVAGTIHIGASAAILNVMRGTIPVCSGHVAISGRSTTAAPAGDKAVSLPRTEGLEYGSSAAGTRPTDPLPSSACNRLADALHMEAKRLHAAHGVAAQAFYLSGGGSRLSVLRTMLAERFESGTHFQPLLPGAGASPGRLSDLPPELAVIGGLALRDPWQR